MVMSMVADPLTTERTVAVKSVALVVWPIRSSEPDVAGGSEVGGVTSEAVTAPAAKGKQLMIRIRVSTKRVSHREVMIGPSRVSS